MENSKNTKLILFTTLFFILIMGSSSWINWFGSPFPNTMNNPSLSANYLFKDKTYNMTLTNLYDDENLTKI